MLPIFHYLFVTNFFVLHYREVKVIPRSSEKYMLITLNGMFSICDSMNFLPGSLDALARNLDSEHSYNLLKQSSIYLENKQNFPLLLQKWSYPYEYAQSINMLSKEQLPKREDFYSELRGENISEEEYKVSKKQKTILYNRSSVLFCLSFLECC